MRTTLLRVSATLVLALALFTSPATAQVIFSEDFSSIPLNADGYATAASQGFTAINVDGTAPDLGNANGSGIPFPTEGWFISGSGLGGDTALISTSWISPAGQVDRYVALPQLTMGTNNQLRWTARSADGGFLETYEVRISTTTPTEAGFLANPAIATITNELDVDNPRSLFIPSTYDNQPVFIAFRNISDDKFWIVLSELEVEINLAASNDIGISSIFTGEYTSYAESQIRPIPISAEVENLGANNATNVQVRLDILEISNAPVNVLTQTTITNPTIAPGNTNVFNFPNWTPTDTGAYFIRFITSMTQTDGNTTNDTASTFILVDEETFARDDAILFGSVDGNLGFGVNAAGADIGNTFELTASDDLQSVTFFVSTADIGNTISANVYNFSPTTGVGTLVASTVTQNIVTAADTAGLYELAIAGGAVTLPAGQYFIGVRGANQVGLNDNNYTPGTIWGGDPVGGFFQLDTITGQNFAGAFLIWANLNTTSTAVAPVVDFSGTPTTVTVGGTVDFTDLSTGSPTQWAWLFPGSVQAASTAQNPTGITYNTVGQFAVSLEASNATGSDIETKNLYINVIAGGGPCANPDTLNYPLVNATAASLFGAGTGFVSGTNAANLQVGQYYPGSGNVESVSIWFGYKDIIGAPDNYDLSVYAVGLDSLPVGAPLASITLNSATIDTSAQFATGFSDFIFSPAPAVTNGFVIAMEVDGPAKNDTLVIVSNGQNDAGGNGAGVLQTNTGVWAKSRNFWSFGPGNPADFDLFMFPVLCPSTVPTCNVTVSETANTDNTSCNGTPSGSYTVTAAGGTAPYTYNNGTASNNNGIFVGATGAYSITVTDALACTATISGTVAAIPATVNANVSAVTPNTSCGAPNGSYTVVGSNGAGQYTYTDGSTTNSNGIFTGVVGAFSVTVTDANGCSETTSGTVADNQPNITVTESANTPNTSCGTPNGSFTVVGGNGAAPYTYSDGSTTNQTGVFNNLVGTYTATATDANGCSATTSVTVADNQPTISGSQTASTPNSACGTPNGSATITASGGVAPYTYNDGSTSNTTGSFTNVVGMFTVSITDANGCTGSVMANVVDNATTLTVTQSTSTPNTACGTPNGAVTLTASGGAAPYTYNDGASSNTSGVFNGVVGTFTVTVTDVNGCTGSTSASVADNATVVSLTATSNTPNTSCLTPNGALTVTASAGTAPYTYTASGSSNTTGSFTGLVGMINVTVVDANGCAGSLMVTVADNTPTINVNTTPTANTSCGTPNGAVSTNSSSGTAPYTYDLDGDINTTGSFGSLAPNTYTVDVTDANGCTASSTFTIANNAPTSLTVTESANTPSTSCGAPDGSVTASATGGTAPYTYTAQGSSNNNGTFSNTVGSFNISVVDALGCTGTLSVTIADNAPTITVTEVPGSREPNTSCDANNRNGEVSISASGGTAPYTYLDAASGNSNTNGVFDELFGSVSFNITDANGCTGTITIAITDNSGTLTVTESAKSPNTSCATPNGSVTLGVSGGSSPYTYSDGNSTGPNNQFDGLSGGNFSVTVTDATGCTGTITATINSNTASPTVTVATTDETSSATADGSATATGADGTTPYTYSWSNGGSGAAITSLTGGPYSVTVTDANGCTGTAGFVIGTGVGIDGIDNLIGFELFPNPTSGMVTIKVALGNAEEVNIEWMNILGERITVENFSNTTNIDQQFDLSGVAKGIYLAKITVGDKVKVEKVIVK